MSDAPVTTPNIGLIKSDVLGSEDVWGDELNQNADTLDAVIGALQTADTGFLKLSGGAMTGPLTLAADPAAAAQAATKGYVDAGDAAAQTNINAKVARAGDTMTGPLTLPANPTVALHAATKGYVDAGDAAAQTNINAKVSKAGDTMTGPLVLAADPTAALHPTTKRYVDNTYFPRAGGVITGPLVVQSDVYPGIGFRNAAGTQIGAVTADTANGSPTADLVIQSAMGTTMWLLDTKVWVSFQGGPQYALLTQAGGTLVGPLTLSGPPTANLHAASKQYVDSQVSSVSGIVEAPQNGSAYGRLNAAWTQVLPLAGGTLSGNLTINGQLNVGSAAPYRLATSAKGNLLLGVPEPASLAAADPTLGGTLLAWRVSAASVDGNLYFDGTNYRYRAANPAVRIGLGGGNLTIASAPSGAQDAVATLTNVLNANATTFAVGGVLSLNTNQIAAGDWQLMRTVDGWRHHQWRTDGWQDAWFETTGIRIWYAAPSTQLMTLDGSGNLTILANAYKPGGGAWTATSDARTHRNEADYAAGLDEVCALHPVSFRYNGAGGTPDDGKTYYGLSAQATQPIMPELVIELDTPQFDLDGQPLPRADTMLEGQLGTDLTALPLALVNCVRALRDQVAALAARVAALEGAA